MTDRDTTLADLRQRVADFVAARDWQQFHIPRNLSVAIAVEAAELMEHFQWLTQEQARVALEDEEKRAHDKIQDLTDRFVKDVDEILANKEKEILEI